MLSHSYLVTVLKLMLRNRQFGNISISIPEFCLFRDVLALKVNPIIDVSFKEAYQCVLEPQPFWSIWQ